MADDPIQNSELAKKNAEDRQFLLEDSRNPDHVMPDGRTVAETRAASRSEQLAEGQADAEIQLQRTREQSIKDDPIYSGTAAEPNASALAIADEPPVAESRKRAPKVTSAETVDSKQ